MPELPEVETIVRGIAPRLAGQRILSAAFPGKRVVRGPAPALAGKLVRAIRRHGKFILFEFEDGVLAIHLGMTGKLVFDGARTAYTRAVFELSGGALFFEDVRQFGHLAWRSDSPPLGPDPLEIGADEFWRELHARARRIKPLLLDQQFLRGMGNIYVDEALFRAGIHPRAVAARLSRPRVLLLHEAMRDVLGLAIAKGGSSISDYVDAEGRKGSFQLLHQVYGKEGEPCPNCGRPIRRIVVGQRGTHYCGKCQRM